MPSSTVSGEVRRGCDYEELLDGAEADGIAATTVVQGPRACSRIPDQASADRYLSAQPETRDVLPASVPYMDSGTTIETAVWAECKSQSSVTGESHRRATSQLVLISLSGHTVWAKAPGGWSR